MRAALRRKTLAIAVAGSALVVGIVVAAGVLADTTIFDQDKGEAVDQATACPDIAPAQSRDTDAEALIAQAATATEAAHQVDAEAEILPVVQTPSNDLLFYFLLQDGSLLQVTGRDGEPHTGTTQLKPKDPKKLARVFTLEDLQVGPERALGAAQSELPADTLDFLTLTRVKCELVWTVGGLTQRPSPPTEFRVEVSNATGVAHLAEGWPKQLGPR
jgi:hypothetical protein